VTEDIVYPSVELILDLHDQIVAEGDSTEPGVRSEDAIGSALQYISEGFFGGVPETIHEKAVHLMRLLVAEHPFVDGKTDGTPNGGRVLYDERLHVRLR
jgi:death-on-curing protein